jgi:ATP-binding cassette, subfamily G (WHITE), member 2, PDR
MVIASIFYNLPNDTSSFTHRGTLLFMLVLLNAFGSILEILTLYAKRTIIDKHARYALYHPSAEAVASMVMDLPTKLVNTVVVNCTLYFMGNLRREAGHFFFLVLVAFSLFLAGE